MNEIFYVIVLIVGITLRVTILKNESDAWHWKWLWMPILLGSPIPIFVGSVSALPMIVEGYFLGIGMILLLDYLDLWPFTHVSTDPHHRRGARVIRETYLIRLIKRAKEKTFLLLGKIPLPIRIEPMHFLMVGGTGAGKTSGILQLLDEALPRGDRAVLADVGGELVARYYDPKTDRLLNPRDKRAQQWSPFAEMEGPWDADPVAKSLVPDGDGSAREWHHYGQTLLAAILQRCWESDQATNAQLLHYATVATVDELRTLVSGLPAATLVAEGNERMLGSVRAILGTHINALAYLPDDAGRNAFSIRRWIKSKSAGRLFFPYQEDQRAALQFLVAAWLDIACRSVLSLNPDPTRRVWVVVDEVAALGRIQHLIDFATRTRKAGGALVVGLHSISQLRATYGRDNAQTLLSCLSTWLILRTNDAETAEYMSKQLGEQEIRRVNQSSGQSSQGESSSRAEQIARQPAILGSELQDLPDRHGYLKLPGTYPISRVGIPIPPVRRSGHKSFEPAPRPQSDFRIPPSSLEGVVANGNAVIEIAL
jgi:hypothetical protein